MLLRCLVLVVLAGGIEGRRCPVAETPLGKARGHVMTSRAGRDFLAFSGLPYARPPLGRLRFEPPLPAEPWSGVKNASEDGPLCAQYNLFEVDPQPEGVEDCLYLSVYTHSLRGKSPVVVHFHGGGYISGNGARNTGPQYLMDEQLVIVDVNYRLSFLGFLSFEEDTMPGNQGMKDQVMALKWVQENIACFGGDPGRVTLVGESSGGGSVYHHTVSPLSKGLFHGGIAESGTGYSPWAVSGPGVGRRSAWRLVAALGCTNTTLQQAVACLRGKNAREIVLQTRDYELAPTLEPPHPGAFLVGPVSAWEHKPVPLIIGQTSAEGLAITLYFQSANISIEAFGKNFTQEAPESLQIKEFSSEPEKVANSIRQYYFPKGDITEKDFVNLTQMYTDSVFTVGIIDGANKHSGEVYYYYFDYLGKYSFGGDPSNNSLLIGAFHIDEIIYLWQYKGYEDLQGDDLRMSKKLVKLWANFASHGTPNKHDIGLKWLEWTPEEHEYLRISKDGFTMQNDFAKDRYKFWKTLNYRDKMKI